MNILNKRYLTGLAFLISLTLLSTVVLTTCGYSPIDITLVMQSSRNDQGQVYYDTGFGYSENNSVWFTVTVSDHFEEYKVQLPGRKISSLRIDPLMQEGEFALKAITIETNHETIHLENDKLAEVLLPLNQVEFIYKDGLVYGVSAGVDPYFELKGLGINNALPFIVLIMMILLIGLLLWVIYKLFDQWGLFTLFTSITFLHYFVNFDGKMLYLLLLIFIGMVYLFSSQGLTNKLTEIDFRDIYTGRYYYVILLIFISILLLVFRLGGHDFRQDEFHGFNAAVGYLFAGEFGIWDWLTNSIVMSYERAWPYTWQIAQVMNLLGIAEWSARIVPVLWGVVFYSCFYFFARYFTKNSSIAVLSLFAAIFYYSYIEIFRFIRMYNMFMPLLLVVIYCLYRGITEDITYSIKNKKVNHIVNSYLNYNYTMLLVALPLIYLNYLIHVNSLVIIPATLLFVIMLTVIEKKKKYFILTAVSVIVSLVVSGMVALLYSIKILSFNWSYLPAFHQYLSLFERRNYIYIDHLFRYPVGTTIGLFLIVTFSLFLIYKKHEIKELFNRYLYLYTILLFSLLFFIFIGDRYASFVYIIHVVSIAIVLIVGALWYFGKYYLKNQVMVVLIVVLLVISSFVVSFNRLYGNDHRFGDFRTAYQVIIDNYNYESEVIIGQYLHTFYLRELESARHISMLSDQEYEFDQFISDLMKYEAGWITWETYKSRHIQNEIMEFISKNFIKYHGAGLDETKVEVYYYRRDLLDPKLKSK